MQNGINTDLLESFIIAQKSVNKPAIFLRKFLCARLRQGVGVNKLYGEEAYNLIYIFYICQTLRTASFIRNFTFKRRLFKDRFLGPNPKVGGLQSWGVRPSVRPSFRPSVRPSVIAFLYGLELLNGRSQRLGYRLK